MLLLNDPFMRNIFASLPPLCVFPSAGASGDARHELGHMVQTAYLALCLQPPVGTDGSGKSVALIWGTKRRQSQDMAGVSGH